MLRADTIRFQLEVSRPVAEKLQALVELTDSASRSEIIRRALGYYWLLASEAKAGNSIEVVGPGSRRRQLVVVEGT